MRFDWLLRLFALFNPAMKDIVARPGRNKKAGNAKAKKLLNRQPRNHEEAILALSDQKRNGRLIFIHQLFTYEDLLFISIDFGFTAED